MLSSTSIAVGGAENGLRNSIEQLVSFIEKGGHVDFIIPNSTDEDDEESSVDTAELNGVRSLAEEVRDLESRIKLLEYDPDKSSD